MEECYWTHPDCGRWAVAPCSRVVRPRPSRGYPTPLRGLTQRMRRYIAGSHTRRGRRRKTHQPRRGVRHVPPGPKTSRGTTPGVPPTAQRTSSARARVTENCSEGVRGGVRRLVPPPSPRDGLSVHSDQGKSPRPRSVAPSIYRSVGELNAREGSPPREGAAHLSSRP